MVRQQRQIDERLLRIETTLQLQQPVPAPAPPPPPEPVPVNAPIISVPVEPPPLASEVAQEPIPEPVAAQRKPTFETQFGLTILNRLGVLTLVLAASFGFKWAVDNNWIGPAGRAAIGVIAGLAALGVADYLWRKSQRTFAQGVTALGIAVLYLSIYAAASYYKLIPFSFAYVCMLSVTVLACALALR